MRSDFKYGASSARFQYRKLMRDCLHYVIVDVSSDGVMEFWSQEPGEVRWFRFDPTAVEREAAFSLWLAGGNGVTGWPLLKH